MACLSSNRRCLHQKDNQKEKRCFRSQRTKKIVLLYFFSPSEPQTSPPLLVVVFDGRDIDFFAEDRSLVYSKVYILRLSGHFLMINPGEPFLPRTPSSACWALPSAACSEAERPLHCHHQCYSSTERCHAEACGIWSLETGSCVCNE